MLPRSRGSIRFNAASVPYTYPRYVTSVTRLNSSALISLMGEKTDAMALFTQMSIGPKVDSTRSAAASTCAGSATSTGSTTARPPVASTSRFASSRPSVPLATSPIHAPCFANSRTVARPTPADAPVMTTTSLLAIFPPPLVLTFHSGGMLAAGPGVAAMHRAAILNSLALRSVKLPATGMSHQNIVQLLLVGNARAGVIFMLHHSQAAAVDRVEVHRFTIPTDFPESDGTLEWDRTTIVVVEVSWGGMQGLGYTYADTATATLIHDTLAPYIKGMNAMSPPTIYIAMWRRLRNLGRPGICSMAISAVDCAIWDLKARLLG